VTASLAWFRRTRNRGTPSTTDRAKATPVELITVSAGSTALVLRNQHKVLRYLAPALAGPLSLAAFIPLVLAQRSALSVSTWIPTFAMGQLPGMLSFFWGHLAFLGILLTWALCSLLVPRLLNDNPWETRSPPPADLVGLAACGLLPIVLAVVSVV